MKVDTVLPNDLSQVPQAAKRAEELGYDGVISAETGNDPFLAHVLAAEHTERLELSTAVAIAFPRSPMTVAQIAWDIQRLSKGRFSVGLGTQVKGHIVRRYGMSWAPPGPRLRDYILMMRAIWDSWQNGTRPEFQGAHYRYTLMTPFFNPGPIEHPRIPIHISALNPYNCRLVGELCDGIKLHAFNTPKYLREEILPNIEKGAKKAGRDPKEIEICGLGFVITGKDEEEIEKAKAPIRQQISFYGSTRSYKRVMDAHGWGDTCLELHALSLAGKWQEMPTRITDEMLEEFAVVGTYDEIVPKIKEKCAGLIDRVGFAISVRFPEDEERLKSLIKELHAA